MIFLFIERQIVVVVFKIINHFKFRYTEIPYLRKIIFKVAQFKKNNLCVDVPKVSMDII